MKKSITGKIIFSYIAIVFAAMFFVGMIYGFAAKYYAEKGAIQSLRTGAGIIADNLKNKLSSKNNVSQVKIRQIARQTLSKNKTLDCSFALISINGTIIYPKTGQDLITFKNDVLPKIIDKISTSANVQINKRKPIRFQMKTEEYMAFIAPVKFNANVSKYIVVLYTSIGPINKLTKDMLYILLLSLSLTGILAIITGIFTARSIARPIVMLRNRAEALAKRDFDTYVDINTQDEIGDLAETLNKMASELKAYDIAQKKFLQNASHELKTPLMSIQGYAEGIKDGVFDDNEKALNIIVEESKRLKGIVEELIFLSKLETMETFYNFSNVSMNEIIKKSVEKVNSIALKNNIKINIVLGKDALLKIDKDKFTQAIINILGNCLRYAKSEINVASSIEGKCYIIRINDDGEGFDENDMNNLFEWFYKGKKGNTGLGLAITKVIVEKHNGTIEAYNGQNKGAEFKIKLNMT